MARSITRQAIRGATTLIMPIAPEGLRTKLGHCGNTSMIHSCVKNYEVYRFQEFVEDQVFSPSLVADALRTTK